MECKVKWELGNPTKVTMKNGRSAARGVCLRCGTKMFKIGKS